MITWVFGDLGRYLRWPVVSDWEPCNEVFAYNLTPHWVSLKEARNDLIAPADPFGNMSSWSTAKSKFETCDLLFSLSLE